MMHNFEIISYLNYEYILARKLYKDCKSYPTPRDMSRTIAKRVSMAIVTVVLILTVGPAFTAISIASTPIFLPKIVSQRRIGSNARQLLSYSKQYVIFGAEITWNAVTIIPSMVAEKVQVAKFHKEYFIPQNKEYTALYEAGGPSKLRKLLKRRH